MYSEQELIDFAIKLSGLKETSVRSYFQRWIFLKQSKDASIKSATINKPSKEKTHGKTKHQSD